MLNVSLTHLLALTPTYDVMVLDVISIGINVSVNVISLLTNNLQDILFNRKHTHLLKFLFKKSTNEKLEIYSAHKIDMH